MSSFLCGFSQNTSTSSSSSAQEESTYHKSSSLGSSKITSTGSCSSLSSSKASSSSESSSLLGPSKVTSAETSFSSRFIKSKHRNPSSSLDSSKSSSSSSTSPTSYCSLRNYPEIVIVMRHGERMDDLFPKWIKKCRKIGRYRAFDGNMPLLLPSLTRKLKDYKQDTPLSEMGVLMAQLVGRGLSAYDMSPDIVYCSPALRCVQTAANARSSALASCFMNLEPGLFQTNKKNRKLSFLSEGALADAGFPVDRQYSAYIPIKEIGVFGEETLAYNKRIHGTFDEILRKAGSNSHRVVLIVGHASTVDLAIGYFASPRQMDFHFQRIGNKIPYCSAAVFRRLQCSQCSNDECDIKKPCSFRGNHCCEMKQFAETSVLPPITYTNFSSRINCKYLLRRMKNKDNKKKDPEI